MYADILPATTRGGIANRRDAVEATSLGIAACGQAKRVRFFRVTELITLLSEAKEERLLLRIRQQLAKLNLLVLDELGYVPASKAGAACFEPCPPVLNRAVRGLESARVVKLYGAIDLGYPAIGSVFSDSTSFEPQHTERFSRGS